MHIKGIIIGASINIIALFAAEHTKVKLIGLSGFTRTALFFGTGYFVCLICMIENSSGGLQLVYETQLIIVPNYIL